MELTPEQLSKLAQDIEIEENMLQKGPQNGITTPRLSRVKQVALFYHKLDPIGFACYGELCGLVENEMFQINAIGRLQFSDLAKGRKPAFTQEENNKGGR